MDKNDSVILIDKPVGMTSFKVTSSIRRKLKIKRAGHAGTLDPIAHGVLPIMTGRATRLIDLIPDDKKRYVAGFMLGLTSDTLDNEGEILSEQPVLCSADEIYSAVSEFIGKIEQIPPMYSALKKDGMKLYELARKGVEVERQPRKITIHSISLISLSRLDDTFIGELDITCSKGTYIRTLVDDIGMKLKCGAIMTSLERVHSNGFDIDDCVSLDEFLNSDDPTKFMRSPDFAVRQFDKVEITPAQSKRFSNGGKLDIKRIHTPGRSTDGEIYRVYGNGEFLGLGIIKNDSLFPKCVF